MDLKISSASDNLAHIIKRKLGTKIHKSEPVEPLLKQENTIASKHGVEPKYTIDMSETLQQRAQKRQRLALLRKQQNIESIMALALDYCPHTVSEQSPDPDWVERFISLAEDSSNKKMQQLWAKIMMGETTRPGTFSYKSLLTLKQMTQREASALQLCGGLSAKNILDSSSLILLSYYKRPSLFSFLRLQNKNHLNLSKAGLNFPDILTLIDIDIIYAQEIESSELKTGDEYQLIYQNAELTLKAKTSGLVLNYYKLTQTGSELIQLSNSPINNQFKHQLESIFLRDFELIWR
ncbi:TIGR03899 family protein [Pseudoalteromonas denitrificans]|uniref:TIGR03899 family protein n=1 Tax=Pseudoalteromonas denitrificans DSM 6059 TaxID=1123010 RepID=A0A1I1PD15_9GAMM|nr:TIGR03899 family protein [Pseudoalteromonas denitrificans]SFD07606.1 TIGR03899 family protein [Pseudoalteromonas denitrificans DSM 6059]